MEYEVDRENSDQYMLNLHPALPDSRFSEDLARKVCLEEHHKNLNKVDSYDVEEAYNEFMECVVCVYWVNDVILNSLIYSIHYTF